MINYLSSGKLTGVWCDWSWCRFRCKHSLEDMSIMGSMDQSDGTYIWPKGLIHYIKEHDVWLPSEFVEHAFSGENENNSNLINSRDIDYSWWEKQKGFNRIKESYDFYNDIGRLKIKLLNEEKETRDYVLNYLNKNLLFDGKIDLIRKLKTNFEGEISGVFDELDDFIKSCSQYNVRIKFESFNKEKREEIVKNGYRLE